MMKLLAGDLINSTTAHFGDKQQVTIVKMNGNTPDQPFSYVVYGNGRAIANDMISAVFASIYNPASFHLQQMPIMVVSDTESHMPELRYCVVSAMY